jgi:hypothetical protein
MPVNSTRGGGSAKAFGLTAGGKKFIIATGGTETTSGDYKIHTFTGPGTFTVSQAGSVGKTDTVDYLVIAGGAGCPPGPGRPSQVGGSGAGGYRESKNPTAPWTASPLASSTSIPVSITGYPISVGGGGSDSSGTDSTFSTITSAGGGKGGIFQGTAVAGGSGGGGGGVFGGTRPGASGNTPPTSPPQGNPGAPGASSDGNGSGGGGGGAGAAGNFINNRTAGPGGSGIGTQINPAVGTTDGPDPALRYFGGGGCGGSGGAGPGGSGGFGGGGPPGSAGTTNTGGGGGGPGGGGGSGIVIIRYLYK